MPKQWWNLKKSDDQDTGEDWQYAFDDPKVNHREIKKAAIAVALFCLVYGAHVVGGSIGAFSDGAVSALVTRQTDFAYLAAEIKAYLPQEFDAQMLKKVQTVIARPADPLQYMSTPVEGTPIAGFGAKEGLEYQTSSGTNVKAVSLGKVKTIGMNEKIGNFIIIEHGQELETVYGYLSESFVKEGDRISQGQIFAKTGKDPVTLEPMFFFALHENNVPVDPLLRMQGVDSGRGGKS